MVLIYMLASSLTCISEHVEFYYELLGKLLKYAFNVIGCWRLESMALTDLDP